MINQTIKDSFTDRPKPGSGSTIPVRSYNLFFENSQIFDTIYNCESFGLKIDSFDAGHCQTLSNFYDRWDYIEGKVSPQNQADFLGKIVTFCRASETKILNGQLYVGMNSHRDVTFFIQDNSDLLVLFDVRPQESLRIYVNGFKITGDQKWDITRNFELHLLDEAW